MKFRKKPVVIEAVQTDAPLDIETLEGVMHASPGDWIITGINGEKYPCKPDIFEKTYEPVSEDEKSMSNKVCEYCMRGRALATGYGISIWINDRGADLLVYGYNSNGDGSNTIRAKIKYCPMCGRDFTK